MQNLAKASGLSPREAALLVHKDIVMASGPVQSLAQLPTQDKVTTIFRTWPGGAQHRGSAWTTGSLALARLLGSAPSSAPFSHAAFGPVAPPCLPQCPCRQNEQNSGG